LHHGEKTDMADTAQLLSAVDFAAHKHRNHRRKGPEDTPYVNHVIGVAHTLATVGGITDIVTLVAAILHDTLEDTETTAAELEDRFGRDVCDVVQEVSDDKTLPKQERKRLQVEHAPHLSQRAKQLKLADKTCNLQDVIDSPAVGWSLERRIDYLDWTEKSAVGCRGVNAALEEHYDRVLRRGRETLEAAT
jgi:guanosine-3',5'-bis(diphosphate) 3'-pyrophosphohydrolase